MNDNKNGKICPLLFASPDFETVQGCVCRKEDCAWWVEDKQKCAVAAIGGESHGKR